MLRSRVIALSLCFVAGLGCEPADLAFTDALTLEVDGALPLNEPVPMRVLVPSDVTPLSVEIIDSALGEDLLLASAQHDGQLYRATVTFTDDDAGPYRLRARITTTDGRVLTSAEVDSWAGPATIEAALSQPAAPTSLSASAGDRRVQLSWSASNVTGFRVHRSLTANFTPSSATLVATTASTSFVDTSVTNGQTYRYRVVAYVKRGRKLIDSAPSAEASATPQATTDLSTPTVQLTSPSSGATYGSAQTVTIAANATDAAGIARVEFVRNGQLVAADTTAPYSTSWSVDATLNGTHGWVARAVDLSGNVGASATVTVTVDITASPAAPQNVTAAAGDGRVTVSFGAVSGASSYDLYWSTTSGVTPSNGARIANVTSPYVHAGLANGLSYFYVVTASNAAGQSAPSVQVAATPVAPADSTAPSFAGLVSATASSTSQINLSWAAASDNVTSSSGIVYDVYRSTSATVSFSSPTYTTAPGATSFSAGGLAQGTLYYFAVRARDVAGNRDGNTVTRSAKTAADLSTLENEVLALVNQKRAAGATCGATYYPPVGALTMNEKLRTAARLHSQDMADQNYFSHTSLDGRTFSQRMTNAGYSGPYPWAENIAAGYSTPAAAVTGWMNSEGHCRNIMSGSYRVIGVGYGFNAASTYDHYWTQDFGGG